MKRGVVGVCEAVASLGRDTQGVESACVEDGQLLKVHAHSLASAHQKLRRESNCNTDVTSCHERFVHKRHHEHDRPSIKIRPAQNFLQPP